MPEQNDHDILIELKTSMAILMKKQDEFIDKYELRHADLVSRVSVLERQDSKDSERFRSLIDQIQRSMNNSNRIEANTSDISVLKDQLQDLKKKSGLWDMANAIAVAIAAAVGWNR